MDECLLHVFQQTQTQKLSRQAVLKAMGLSKTKKSFSTLKKTINDLERAIAFLWYRMATTSLLNKNPAYKTRMTKIFGAVL
jgi:hypothetical protein